VPTLPSYDSSRNIKPQLSAPLRDEAAQMAANQNKITGTITAIAQQWSDAHDTMQLTEATAKSNVMTADILSRASADPDFKNHGKYLQELEEVKKNAASGIDNKEIANKAKMQFEQDSMIAGIKIQSDARTKEMAFNKANIKTGIDAIQKKKLTATDAEKMQADAEIEDMIEANLKAGVISYDEADKMLKDSQKLGVQYAIYADPASKESDSQVLKDLQDPNGKYKYLDADVRLDLIQDAQRRIFQNNQTYKREAETMRNERFQNIFAKANQGTLTLHDLDQEMAVSEEQGGIPQKQLLEIKEGIQRRVKSDLSVIVESDEKAANYLKFIDSFIDDETDRQKAREDLASAYKDMILSDKEAAYLNSLKRETEDIEFQRTNVPFKGAVNAIRSTMRRRKTATESEAALSIKQLLNAAADGKDPIETSKQILYQDAVKRNPNIMLIPEGGQMHIDADGNVKILFPDGHDEEAKGE